MDLGQQFMCGFMVLVGAACIVLGVRLIQTFDMGATSGADAFARIRTQVVGVAPAAVCILFGATIIGLVLMNTVGPWRPAPAGPFPLRILDLNAPPAAIERTHPPVEP